MRVGEIYSVQLGYYEDRYLVTGDINKTIMLRRVRTPKSKIDGVRLPEIIAISYHSEMVKQKPIRKRK